MVSNVDATKPTEGQAYTKDVRNNFSIIKTEIEAVQLALTSIDLSGYLPLTGGVMNGKITNQISDLNWGGLYSIGLHLGGAGVLGPGMAFEDIFGTFKTLYLDGGTMWISYGTTTTWDGDIISFETTGVDLYTGLYLKSDPTAPLEAATKQYTDTKVSKAGDVMTGTLTVFGNAGSTGITSSMGSLGRANPIILRAADGTGSGWGGGVSLVGGSCAPTGPNGGSISISGGSGNATGGPPGNVTLNGGFGYHDDGGNIILSPGGVSGATSYGMIKLSNLRNTTQADPTSIWNNNGVLNIGAGAALVTIEHLDELKETIKMLTKRITLLESHLPPPGE